MQLGLVSQIADFSSKLGSVTEATATSPAPDKASWSQGIVGLR